MNSKIVTLAIAVLSLAVVATTANLSTMVYAEKPADPNCFGFTSSLSTIRTCLGVLHRINLLPDIQWSLFFGNFSFTGHDFASIDQKICNGAIKIIG